MQRRRTHRRHRAGRVALDLDWTPAVAPLDALLVAFEDLDRVGRHLLERLEGHEAHAPRAGQTRRGARGVVGRLAQHRARDVVRDVAAADHHDVRGRASIGSPSATARSKSTPP